MVQYYLFKAERKTSRLDIFSILTQLPIEENASEGTWDKENKWITHCSAERRCKGWVVLLCMLISANRRLTCEFSDSSGQICFLWVFCYIVFTRKMIVDRTRLLQDFFFLYGNSFCLSLFVSLYINLTAWPVLEIILWNQPIDKIVYDVGLNKNHYANTLSLPFQTCWPCGDFTLLSVSTLQKHERVLFLMGHGCDFFPQFKVCFSVWIALFTTFWMHISEYSLFLRQRFPCTVAFCIFS